VSDVHARARSLRPPLAPTLLLGILPIVGIAALALISQAWLAPALAASGNDFYAKILVDIAISVILAVSLTMVNGFTGQFSIGHAAFMAVGAYAAACIVYYGSFRLYGDANIHGGTISTMITGRDAPFVTGADLLFLASLLAGGLVAAICGYVVGLPSLRLKGDYLAIVTLGFGEIVRVLVQSQTTDVLSPYAYVTEDHIESIPSWASLAVDDSIEAQHIAEVPIYLWPKYAGGALGFGGLPFYTSLFWVVLFAGITLLVAYRVKHSSFGRAFLSIREDEIAAESMGVNVTRYKVRAFVIAAFFAGIAGGLFAHTVGVQLNPAELGFQKSFDIIIMVVLGGLGSISGATLAAVIVTILPELLRKPETLAGLWPWGLGLLGIGMVVAVLLKKSGREAALGRALIAAGVTLLGFSLLSRWAISAGVDLGRYRMVLFALALIAMMILRPQGLLGVREVWDGSLWKDMIRRRTQKRARKAGGAA
jgi:branched-chain amino acid transport system permease protein